MQAGSGWSGRSSAAGGGAGNPGGKGYSYPSNKIEKKIGETGTGGFINIYCIDMYNNASIYSNGTTGGIYNNAVLRSSGGSSGGGTINIFYNGVFENHGNIVANGGGYNENRNYSSKGGDGAITIGNISSGTFVKN